MTDFHFESPLWLLALVPLALLLWALLNRPNGGSSWRNVIDERLQPLLLEGQNGSSNRRWFWLLAAGWLIAVIALANPAWERKPRPVFQTDTARVIVLDLSTSMTIADLRPSRLARAKFKIRDLLDLNQEGQLGLVAFAGDAFTVTPLTRDNDTIAALLDALEPSIMPVQGSRADLGLLQAGDLLKQAGIPRGQIILIADGAERSPAIAAAKSLHRQGHQISVLGIGTEQGGPLPGIRDANGKPIVVALQRDVLKQIAAAGGGIYRELSSGDMDIRELLADTPGGLSDNGSQSDDLAQQEWEAEGPWLVLLLLPLAALSFRRGWLLGPLLLFAIGSQPSELMASPWEDLWLRKDQQAAQALQAGEYETAEQIATDPMTRGSAAYKAGKYNQALDAFSQGHGADAAYNRGNALARLGKYQEAIKAYQEALALDPEMADAKMNKERVEELLKKMQQQEKQSSQQQQKPDQQQNNEQQQQSDSKQQDSSSEQQKDTEKKQGGTENNPDQEQQQSDAAESDSQNEQQSNAQKQKEKPKENQFAKAAEELEQNAQDKDKKGNPETHQETGEDNADKDDAENADTHRQQQPRQPTPHEEARPASDKAETAREASPESLSDEEKLAAKQWLRRIPDDPGGLLRRKFEMQYQERARSQRQPSGNPW